MTTIYNFDGNRISTGLTQEIGPDGGIGQWWTDVAPPSLEGEQVASFQTPGWIILDSYPYPIPPEAPAISTQVRVTNKSTETPMVI